MGSKAKRRIIVPEFKLNQQKGTIHYTLSPNIKGDALISKVKVESGQQASYIALGITEQIIVEHIKSLAENVPEDVDDKEAHAIQLDNYRMAYFIINNLTQLTQDLLLKSFRPEGKIIQS